MPTPNYGWVLPDVLGSEGTWGQVLNDAIEEIDEDLQAVSDVADAALPKAGGALTGRLDAKTATSALSNLGSLSGAQNIDVSTAQVFTFTVTGALAISFTNVAAGTLVTGVILRITNPGVAAITWPAGVRWPAGTEPDWTVDGIDLVVLLTFDNGASWDAVRVSEDVS